ncbi:hypothetical protein Slala04_66350 [Streptomyces lavendulae subsp. lavendulae]|nr:hypothetical protein Slala04_66350 [Streptomyces lavendulae subsp. lavendulae]
MRISARTSASFKAGGRAILPLISAYQVAAIARQESALRSDPHGGWTAAFASPHRQVQQLRTEAMVRTIPGFGNRGSSAIFRAATDGATRTGCISEPSGTPAAHYEAGHPDL